MKLFITVVIMLLLVIIGLSFGAQNDFDVTVNYLIAKGHFSFPSVIALTLVLGVLIGLLATLFGYSRMRLRLLRLERQNKKLKAQLVKSSQ